MLFGDKTCKCSDAFSVSVSTRTSEDLRDMIPPPAAPSPSQPLGRGEDKDRYTDCSLQSSCQSKVTKEQCCL